MALRLKSYWYNDGTERSAEDVGGALAFNIWRISMDKAVTLHGKDFIYTSDKQRLDVIAEYTIFQTQIVERLAHKELKDEQRQALITAIVLRLAKHFSDNATELVGPADYQTDFINLFNLRSGEYAELGFEDNGPTYPFLRHLGYEIQQVMGASQANRWVIDQVMDVDGPEVYKQLKRVTQNLLD